MSHEPTVPTKSTLIAHRGLLYGPNKELENHPDQIKKALDMSFDVEVDVWLVDGCLFLGHDEPQYPITIDFLNNDHIWVHAKNYEALEVLSQDHRIHLFSHDIDKYVLTSRSFIWTYPDKTSSYGPRSIVVMPERFCEVSEIYEKFKHCYGICSDYVVDLRTFG